MGEILLKCNHFPGSFSVIIRIFFIYSHLKGVGERVREKEESRDGHPFPTGGHRMQDFPCRGPTQRIATKGSGFIFFLYPSCF